MFKFKKVLNYILILVVVGFIFILYEKNSTKMARTGLKEAQQRLQRSPEDNAERYLKQLQAKISQDKKLAELKLKGSNHSVYKEESAGKSAGKGAEVNPLMVAPQRQIRREVKPQPQLNVDADQFTDQRTQMDQFSVDLNDINREEYIRQFKENARQNGYEITINDELEVIKVVPVRKPQNFDLNGVQNPSAREE